MMPFSYGTSVKNRISRRLLLHNPAGHRKTLNKIAAFCGKIKEMSVSQAFMTVEKARGGARQAA